MFQSRKASILMVLFSMGALIGLLTACGVISTEGPTATCAANTAQIAVFDTGMKRVCGCAEGSGQFFSTSGGLLCTINLGTVVYFNYVGITNSHQITIQSLTTLPLRSASSSTQTDGWSFTSTGTFTFQDIYTTIGGTFTVH